MKIFIYSNAHARRLKDVVTTKGVRENILIGYGLVVGLKGTGDSSSEVTTQSLLRLFSKLGMDVKSNAIMKSKNTAAVIVTAKLPPFARVGNQIDCVVNSIGDSSGLDGGTLIVTPLRAGDQNIYAVAQGTVSTGGRVISGATIEKELDLNFADKKSLRLTLIQPDFTTAARSVAVINSELGGKFALARDSGTIDLMVPSNYEGNTVGLLALIENFNVNTDIKAKVVLNERTGTVVIGESVQIMPIGISHGDLAIEIKGAPKGTKPERIAEIKSTTSVSDLIQTLNRLGVSPKDLVAIFQTIKQAGALGAELEVL